MPARKKDPLSPYIAALYMRNGLDIFYKQTIAGLTVGYRGKRWLAAQAGAGRVLDAGQHSWVQAGNWALILSVGAFVPF
jgi:hypothetical protein